MGNKSTVKFFENYKEKGLNIISSRNIVAQSIRKEKTSCVEHLGVQRSLKNCNFLHNKENLPNIKHERRALRKMPSLSLTLSGLTMITHLDITWYISSKVLMVVFTNEINKLESSKKGKGRARGERRSKYEENNMNIFFLLNLNVLVKHRDNDVLWQ